MDMVVRITTSGLGNQGCILMLYQITACLYILINNGPTPKIGIRDLWFLSSYPTVCNNQAKGLAGFYNINNIIFTNVISYFLVYGNVN